MASTKISRSISSAGTTTKGTFSAWVKRGNLAEGFLFLSQENGNNNFRIRFNPEVINVEVLQGGSVTATLSTVRKYLDTSAWYHICVTIDSTDGTANDRMKIYTNGVDEQTVGGYSARTNPSQNANMSINEAGTQYVGAQDSSNYFDGLMSHVHYVDGTAYPASTFGETDSTSGIWKPKTAPTVTYGTNGFFLKFENSGNMDLDSSSNGHTMTTGGTLTQTQDSPSNNYTVWNRQTRVASSGIQSGGWGHGSTYVATSTSNDNYSFPSTFSFPGTGKFYMEFKVGNIGTDFAAGIGEVEAMTLLFNTSGAQKFCNNAKGWAYVKAGQKETGGSGSSYGNSFTSGDYIGLAYNNGALWFSKNGTWQNSATISEINAGTTTNAAFTGIATAAQYFIMFAGYNDAMIEMNAGNGAFRATQDGTNNPSAGDTGAKFKYTVPTGYQPLSTKGLNS